MDRCNASQLRQRLFGVAGNIEVNLTESGIAELQLETLTQMLANRGMASWFSQAFGQVTMHRDV